MFYHFNQNNSGDRFHNNSWVCNHVIIEARCATEELKKSVHYYEVK
jgi:hypothetical protein